MKRDCAVTECDRPKHAHTYCTMHMRRWKLSGDPLIVGERNGRPLKGSVPSHAAIHKRLARTLGSARKRACVDCGGRARDWSYDAADPNELTSPQGPYSLDLNHYQPRCVSCHRKFDGAGNRPRNERGQFVPSIHPDNLRWDGEPLLPGVDIHIQEATDA